MLGLLRTLWQQSGGAMVAVAVSSVVSGAASAALVAVINEHVASATTDRAQLAWRFAMFASIQIGAGLVAELILASMSTRTLLDLRVTLARRVATVPLERLERLGKARLLSALTEDVPRFTEGLACLPTVLTNATVAACVVVYVGWIAGRASLLWLAAVIVGVLTVSALSRWLAIHEGRARRGVERLYRHVVSLIEGAKELRLHAPRRVAFLVGGMDATAGEVRTAGLAFSRAVAALSAWSRVMLFGAVAFVLGFDGSAVIPEGVGARLIVVLLFLMPPLTGLFMSLGPLNRASVARARLSELGVSLGVSPPLESVVPERRALVTVRLSGVRHVYASSDREFELGPIDLEITSGRLTFLVGGNGSGKSTLAKLIVGLYRPTEGTVAVDGVEATPVLEEWYRSHFSAVFLDFHLFPRLWGIDVARVRDAGRGHLRTLGIEQLVPDWDELATDTLSSGQRKRLALWVAMLEDRPVWVLDEVAAEQDPAFKEQFYRQFLPALRRERRAVVVITHDERYFDVADEVIKLEHGRIVERRCSPPS